ncbi:hypothetical protein PR202_ga07345 [Eleusine coracana subsp. coracana]|uniref:Receptor kinase-like protein Xa21 n=1 Tax=Eleusine coracana subsp. coracana TaxID=191504 RepID=A0AAV5BZC3_ELECO|nr:hypothetical protein PR202_ga07345 [Eleusine coracana subsp. coracana]
MERHGYNYKHHGCSVVLVVSLLFALPSWAWAATGNAVADSDHRALTQFRSLVTDDPRGALASWAGGNASGPCGWHGVTCGARGRRRGRVTALDLRGLGLAGSVGSSLSGLTYLRRLDLAENRLSGGVPSPLPPSLEHLNLSHNALHGTVPPELGSLRRLQMFNLVHNNLTGTIPASVGNLTSLIVLSLTNNNLAGAIPGALGESQLKAIGLSGNKLGGVLPGSIANLSTSMEYFSISGNMVSGQIPQGIANLINLRSIFMHLNNLTGTIPASLVKLDKLSNLYLYGNKLSGQIPPTIGNLTTLMELPLHDNMLTGPIPSSLGSCPLQKLGLDFNRLTGPIPKELLLISTLYYATFQGNMLIGSLPSEIGHLTNLEFLDISGNSLTGEIPASLGNCQILQYCIMKGNIFQGKIPDSMAQVRGLVSLDLSRNNFSGHIPDFLGTVKSLEQLDISYNNFYGEVPKSGIFLNTSAFSIKGDMALCGGIPQLKLPPCSSNGSMTSKRSRKLVMTISVVTAILGITLLLALFVFCHQRRKFKISEDALPIINDQHVRVSYINLVNATNGFASENLIGTGSFGSVYKGTMFNHVLEMVVAVKVLNLQQRGASQSFIAECETLRSARHRNLVKILTVCSSNDSGGLDFKAIVFDYLPNGNLDQWLHQHVLGHGTRRGLDLAQRIDIAIDVASALEYLHHYKPTPIVHCDLKPSNILLDNDMVAHVGDFGLARFMHQDQTNVLDLSSGWATRRGTIGYAAPGKRPTDSSFGEGLSLHSYVQLALQDQQVASVVDQQLLPVQDQEHEGRTSSSSCTRETIVACIASVLQIGILCSKELPTNRLLIVDALRQLHGVKERYNRMHLPSDAK